MAAKKRYYAIDDVAPNEVLIFRTQSERDDWVNFQDEFSRAFPEIAHDEDLGNRLAITREEAVLLVGDDLLDDRRRYIPLEFLDNVYCVVLNVPFIITRLMWWILMIHREGTDIESELAVASR